MSKLRILAIVLITLIVVALGIAPATLRYLAEREISRLQRDGLRIRADGISGFIFGVKIKEIDSWTPIPLKLGAGLGEFPFQIKLESLSAAAIFHPLSLGFSTDLNCSLYGGTAEASIRSLLTSPLVTGRATRVDLSIHPQLRALGLDRGVLDISISDHPLDRVWLKEARYTMKLDELELIPPQVLRNISGISHISSGRVELIARIAPNGVLTVERGDFDSSLASGNIKGGAVIHTSGQITNINASFEVALNRDESARLAPWLPLLTGQAVASTVNTFSCRARSVSCSIAHSFRIENDCIKLSCS